MSEPSDKLIEQWNSFLAEPIPPEAQTQEVNGLNLVFLDEDTAGVLTSYFADTLTETQRELLSVLSEDLEEVVANTSGDTRRYFAHLCDLANAALKTPR